MKVQQMLICTPNGQHFIYDNWMWWECPFLEILILWIPLCHCLHGFIHLNNTHLKVQRCQVEQVTTIRQTIGINQSRAVFQSAIKSLRNECKQEPDQAEQHPRDQSGS